MWVSGWKNGRILCHFLLNKDISQLWYESGHIHKKIGFFEENTFFLSQLHNFIPKYLCIIQFFMCVSQNI